MALEPTNAEEEVLHYKMPPILINSLCADIKFNISTLT